MTSQQVNAFKSDFKIVADYFVQTTSNHNYIPAPDVVRHVDEILKMLRILTKDSRYEFVLKEIKPEMEEITMCEVLDQIEARGIEKGRQEEKAAYEAREANYLSEIAALKAELEKFRTAGVRV